MTRATAFWVDAPGAGSLRVEELRDPRPGEVLVRTLHTGISRGTESLVFRGQVPAPEVDRMRAPFQEGDFPGPVKYGYLNVGVIEHGPRGLVGRTVFTLFPHQSAFVVPESAVAIVPDGIPARRAVLAGAVETAVNILWDAAPSLG
ncbi:MAG TPA: dehydrogenase, partial [Microbacterium sp.]|nr:dehydrogenase [Microbacterium sp.]